MSKQPDVRMIPWKKIVVPEWQQRSELRGIPELAATLEAHGQLEPCLVEEVGDGTFILRAGRRRYKAFEHNGWQGRDVFCHVRTYKKGDHLGAIADNWIENSQQSDVSFLDQARWIHQLVTGNYPVPEGEVAVPYDKKTVGARLRISLNYLNKMLRTIENMDEKVVEKAAEVQVPARLAIAIGSVKGSGSSEEDREKDRAAKQKAMVSEYKTEQRKLETLARKRGVRRDKGHSKNNEHGESCAVFGPQKKIDTKGRTAALYLEVLDAKTKKGNATDKSYFEGMFHMLSWLTSDSKRCPSLVASDFEQIQA